MPFGLHPEITCKALSGGRAVSLVRGEACSNYLVERIVVARDRVPAHPHGWAGFVVE